MTRARPTRPKAHPADMFFTKPIHKLDVARQLNQKSQTVGKTQRLAKNISGCDMPLNETLAKKELSVVTKEETAL